MALEGDVPDSFGALEGDEVGNGMALEDDVPDSFSALEGDGLFVKDTVTETLTTTAIMTRATVRPM